MVSLNRQSAQTCKEKLGAFRKGLKKLPLEFGEGRFCQLEFIYFKFEISSLIIYSCEAKGVFNKNWQIKKMFLICYLLFCF